MESMKVVNINEAGEIAIVEKERPVEKENEALLKIKYCGICGSDLATYTGNQPFASYPRIPGHEFSAEIVEVGENDLGLEKGMIVTANPYFNCGKCYSCERGHLNCCESNETMGVQRDGSFSEYIVMPIERIYPSDKLDAQTLALVEPFSIGYHAISRGDIKKGDKVLIFGAGAIGIFAMISAKLKGAEVYVTDMHESRLNKAIELGADGIINISKEDLEERVNEITDSKGMDICVEAVGAPETFLDAIENVAFAGQIILIGNGKREVTFNQSVLLQKELDVIGSRNSLKEMKELVNILENDELDVDIKNIITAVYPFDQSTEAFELLLSEPENQLKVLIKFD